MLAYADEQQAGGRGVREGASEKRKARYLESVRPCDVCSWSPLHRQDILVPVCVCVCVCVCV
jgi:hypothetical protein